MTPPRFFLSFPLSLRRAMIRRGVGSCFIALLLGSGFDGPAASQRARALELGQPVERELAGGEAHRYEIALAAGQYLRVVVAQRSIDVAVTLAAPNGEKLVTADSLSFADGQEVVSTLAEVAGNYRVEVRSPDEPSYTGRYEVKVSDLRAATERDRQRAAAERLFAQGEELRRQQTLASSQEAIKRYEEALPLWRAAEDHAGEAATQNKIGMISDGLFLKSQAIGAYNQAVTLWRAAGDRAGEAEALTNFGFALDSISQKQKAMECYTRALELHRAVGSRRGEGLTTAYLGYYHEALGDKQKALDYYTQGLAMLRMVRDREYEGITLTSMAVSYDGLGERGKSLELAGQALKIHRAGHHRFGEAYVLHVLGDVSDSVGEKEQAQIYLAQAIALAREIGERRVEAASLELLGNLYCTLERLNSVPDPKLTQQGITLLNQALALWRAIGYKRGEANTLKLIGDAHLALREFTQTLDYTFAGLKISREIGDRRGEASQLGQIGRAYYLLGDLPKARDYLHQSWQIKQALGDPYREGATLLNLAEVEQSLGHFTLAQSLADQGLQILESLRLKLDSADLRAADFGGRRGHYDQYVRLLMRRHQQQSDGGFDAAALEASERGRARSLLDLLVESSADLRQGVDPALLAQQDALRQQLEAKAAEQNNPSGQSPNTAQATQLANQLAELKTDLQRVEAQIKTQSPRYAALTQPQPLSLAEIRRQVLDDNALLLEYALDTTHDPVQPSYLWAVTATTFTGYELPDTKVIEQAARRVYDLLTARNQRPKFEPPDRRQARISQADAELQTAAAELSQMLLGPVAAELGKRRLLIVADGALQYVPFAALPAPRALKDEGGRMKNEGKKTARPLHPSLPALRPLITDHEIVNLPSATALAILRQELAGRKAAPKIVAVLADPVFENDDERVKAIAAAKPVAPKNDAAPLSAAASDVTRSLERAVRDASTGEERGTLARLPFTRQEAKAILALAPAGARREALDFDASRATATSGELGQYRYVHFATHGLIDNVHPELSGVVLSLVDREGKNVDGFLRLVEIFNLKLPAELVVLSGCRTGLGKEVKGEGLIGMTRGFMYAGAARVMVSLWNVNDRATAELMAKLYRRMLGEGRSPAAALRAAQLEMLKGTQWRAPYFWASFVLMGEPN